MNNEELQRLGLVLKQLREERGLTLRAVADKMNITHKSVQFWEQGVNEMKLSKFIEICNLYNITPDELLEKANIK